MPLNSLLIIHARIRSCHTTYTSSKPPQPSLFLCAFVLAQSDESGYAPIVAHHGKISIIDTAVISYDESLDGPDERLEGRAYIAALSSESDDQTKVWESRMDVHNSEISYLGNEGDYHNDISELVGNDSDSENGENR